MGAGMRIVVSQTMTSLITRAFVAGATGWCHKCGSGPEFDKHDAEPDGKQAGQEIGGDVGEGEERAVFQQELGGVPAEGGEGGEAAQEADDDGMAESGDEEQIGRVWLDGGIGREPLEELANHSDEQTADEVDEERGERKVLARSVREGEADAVAGEGTERAAEGDEEGITH